MPEIPATASEPTSRVPDVREAASMEALIHGIFAITMTLLILELRVPDLEEPGELWHALRGLGPQVAGYVFGFAYLMAVWLSLRDFLRQLNGMTRAVSLLLLVVIGTVSLTPFTVSALAAAIGNTDDLGVAVRLLAAVAGVSFVLAAVAAKVAFRQGLVPANGWFAMSWPRALLLSAAPATAGFLLSYVQPWVGLAVLSVDIVLGILDLGQAEEVTEHQPGETL